MTSNNIAEVNYCDPNEPPDFGYTSAATGNSVAVNEEFNLVHDIFGSNLDNAIIKYYDNGDAAYCQGRVVKESERLAAAKLKVFVRCKKRGLKGKTTPQIINAAGIEGCLIDPDYSGSVASDPRGKISRRFEKLEKLVTFKCAGVDLATAFPGACNDAEDFASCVDERVDGRVCLLLNAVDNLNLDCDLFDDGEPNGSTLPPLPVDHFLIYDANGPDAPAVELIDQFGPQDPNLDLGSVMWFMPPANKTFGDNIEGMVDPNEHLACYQIPPDEPGLDGLEVFVRNQFCANQLLKLDDAVALCVPSERSLEPVPPAEPQVLDRDHYICYEVLQAEDPNLTVTLQDEFVGPLETMVHKPEYFCAPVNKNSEGVSNLVEHLTCYLIDGLTPVNPSPLRVRNQFHDWSEIFIDTGAKHVCVPSLKSFYPHSLHECGG
jgi:hypothetical protein